MRSLVLEPPGIGGSPRTAVDAGARRQLFDLADPPRPFRGDARSAALTVRNDDREVLVQAEVMLWEQVDGEDRLTPTRDLLVSPAVFTLPPNGSQLVRVALRNPPADTTRELSYRLILQEVPQPANPDFTGLQVTLRLSVPVFVAAQERPDPRLALVRRPQPATSLRAHRAELGRRACPHTWILDCAGGGRRCAARAAGGRLHTSGPVAQLEPR